MKTKTIKQTVTFAAKPADLYDLLMNAEKHADFSGSAVTMSRKVGGKFEVFDGYCHGYNIELKEGRKIVQGWHFAEDGWPDDHFSVCTFEFTKAPKGTKLIFTQTDIPEHKAASLKDGWKQFYWEPMKAYLKDSSKDKV
jgi:activator of HSP90 ATPase